MSFMDREINRILVEWAIERDKKKQLKKKKIVQLSNAHNLYRGDQHGCYCNKTKNRKEKKEKNQCCDCKGDFR